MAEGIDFLLDLQAKLKSLSTANEQLERMTAGLGRADTALKRTEKNTGFFGRALGAVGGTVRRFAGMALSHFAALASFEGLKRLAGTVVDLGRDALQAAGEAERLRMSFRFALGQQPADELLEFLDNLARHTEFTDGALKSFGRQLTNAGFKGEAFRRAMAATLDIAALSENKMEGAGNAIALFSAAMLKGSISMRELRAAKIEVKPFFADLAKQLGIGVKEVEKRLQDGKIKTEVLLEALNAAVLKKTGQSTLGAAAVQMSGTFLAQVEKMRDIIPNLFEELERSGGLKGVTASLKSLTEALAPDSPSGKKIIAGLETLLNAFARMVTEIDFEKWSQRLMTALKGVELATAFIAQLFDETARVLGAFVTLGEKLGDAIQFLGEKGGELGQALWQGMLKGLLSGVTAVKNAAVGLAESAVSRVKDVLGIHSPSSVFGELGQQTTLGFTLAIRHSIPEVQHVVEQAFAPAALLGGIVPAVSSPPPVSMPIAEALGAPAAVPVVMSGGQAGGNRLEANIVVNVGGAPRDEGEARALGETLAATIREHLLAAWEQMAAEGGAA